MPRATPELLPTAAELDAERARPLADKHGVELRQGQFAADVLSDPRTGRHLVETMLRPTPEALARLEEFKAEGKIDFGTVLVERRGNAGILELRNPRHLNAEDGSTDLAERVGGRPDPARSRRSRSACSAADSSITPATRRSGSSAPGST